MYICTMLKVKPGSKGPPEKKVHFLFLDNNAIIYLLKNSIRQH